MASIGNVLDFSLVMDSQVLIALVIIYIHATYILCINSTCWIFKKSETEESSKTYMRSPKSEPVGDTRGWERGGLGLCRIVMGRKLGLKSTVWTRRKKETSNQKRMTKQEFRKMRRGLGTSRTS